MKILLLVSRLKSCAIDWKSVFSVVPKGSKVGQCCVSCLKSVMLRRKSVAGRPNLDLNQPYSSATGWQEGFEILSQDYLKSSARINHNFLVQILSQNYSELLNLWPTPTVPLLKFSWGSKMIRKIKIHIKMIKTIKIHLKMINLEAPSQFHLCQSVCKNPKVTFITWTYHHLAR